MAQITSDKEKLMFLQHQIDLIQKDIEFIKDKLKAVETQPSSSEEMQKFMQMILPLMQQK